MKKNVHCVSRVKLGFCIGTFEDLATSLPCHAQGPTFPKEQVNLLLADYLRRTKVLTKENP